MNIKDTSLLYRYATLFKMLKEDPPKNVCDVFVYAILTTILLAALSFFVACGVFITGASGAYLLALLGVTEPGSFIVAAAMAVTAGILSIGTVLAAMFSLLKIAKQACTAVDASKLKGTLIYRCAALGHPHKDSVKNGCDIIFGLIATTSIAAVCTVILGFLWWNAGRSVLWAIGRPVAPSESLTATTFLAGAPVLLAVAGIFFFFDWLCKNSALQITKET